MKSKDNISTKDITTEMSQCAPVSIIRLKSLNTPWRCYMCVSLLSANQDPIATIMGPAFATVGGVPGDSNTLLEIHERLAREKAMGNEGGSTDELDSSFRLLLLLNNLDIKMLHTSVKQMGK